MAPAVVLACGNPSRGDDALGPLLLQRLAAWLESEGLAGRIDLVEDFQFQIEHALDLAGRSAVLFIDAGQETAAPYTLAAIEPDARLQPATHALTPAQVLAVHRRVVGGCLPRVEVLCVRGESFALGEGLSVAATANLEAAWRALRQWCLGLPADPGRIEKA